MMAFITTVDAILRLSYCRAPHMLTEGLISSCCSTPSEPQTTAAGLFEEGRGENYALLEVRRVRQLRHQTGVSLL